ncbi:MAG: alpha/beta hydrolase [Magnetovibrio sp.]|nr:alpha/beta hydrolase [Magnetovibrio sp.]
MNTRPTLILIPGLLCDAALWARQVVDLSDLVDVQIADISDADSMAELAAGILDDAPDEFALAGLSMGGYVAQEIMRQEPNRVTHLAFVDTNARADLPEQSENRKRMMDIAQAGKLDGVVAEMLPNLIHPDHLKVPKIADVFGQMAANFDEEAFINQQTAIMNRQDGRAELAKISCPTLVLCGEQDALTPIKVHEEMVEGIGDNATLVVVPHSGHLSPIEQPDAVSAAMRAWLQT